MTHDQYIDALIDCYETGQSTGFVRFARQQAKHQSDAVDQLAEMMRRQSEATARAVDGLAKALARNVNPAFKRFVEALG